MKLPSQNSRLLAAYLLVALVATPVSAQTMTGTPGAPSATTTIDGRQISAASRRIRRHDQSRCPQLDALLAAAGGAAEGRAQRSPGPDRRCRLRRAEHLRRRHPDPALDRIASMGLRYTQFHTTSLCSPTRAALITGRNHHSVGFGVISEASTGYPGYDSVITTDKATIGTDSQGQRLRDLLVRQEPQHAGFPDQPGGPFRPVAESAWALSISMASTAARPISGSLISTATHAHLSLCRQSRATT